MTSFMNFIDTFLSLSNNVSQAASNLGGGGDGGGGDTQLLTVNLSPTLNVNDSSFCNNCCICIFGSQNTLNLTYNDNSLSKHSITYHPQQETVMQGDTWVAKEEVEKKLEGQTNAAEKMRRVTLRSLAKCYRQLLKQVPHKSPYLVSLAQSLAKVSLVERYDNIANGKAYQFFKNKKVKTGEMIRLYNAVAYLQTAHCIDTLVQNKELLSSLALIEPAPPSKKGKEKVSSDSHLEEIPLEPMQLDEEIAAIIAIANSFFRKTKGLEAKVRPILQQLSAEPRIALYEGRASNGKEERVEIQDHGLTQEDAALLAAIACEIDARLSPISHLEQIE